MHYLVLVRIPRKIPKIQNIFDIQLLAGFLVDLLFILFNYLYHTASHCAVSQNRYLNHLDTCSPFFVPYFYSFASIFTLLTPFLPSMTSSISDTLPVVGSTWILRLKEAIPLMGML